MSISVEQVEEFANSPVQACLDYARPMRPPLSLEIAAARGVAALSRRLGAGGGTTIPGKLLAELVPERWRESVAALPANAQLVYNADDPQLAVVGEAHAGGVAFGLDDPGVARPSMQHAADSKYCVRCGTPYAYAAAYVGHLGDYRCPACGHRRPPLDVAARELELNGLESVGFRLVTPAERRRVELRV